MVMLELDERFPTDGVTELAWEAGIAAFRTDRRSPARGAEAHPVHRS